MGSSIKNSKKVKNIIKKHRQKKINKYKNSKIKLTNDEVVKCTCARVPPQSQFHTKECSSHNVTINTAIPESSNQSDAPPQIQTTRIMLRCWACTKRFHRQSELRQHLIQHINESYQALSWILLALKVTSQNTDIS